MTDAKTYLYDNRIYSSEEIRALIDSSLSNRSTRATRILEFLDPCEYLLDVGCGAGDITYLMANAGKVKRVLGIDTLSTSIEIGKDFFKLPNLSYQVGDIFEEEFPSESFDCITWFECIEHVDNPSMFLREFYRLLKPNGVLLISTPNAYGMQLLLGLFLGCVFRRRVLRQLENISSEPRNTGTQLDHLYMWDMPLLYRLCNRNGLVYERHAYVGASALSLYLHGKPILQFPPLAGSRDSTLRAKLYGPLCNNLLLKVRKSTRV